MDIPVGALTLILVLATGVGIILTAAETALLRTTRSMAHDLQDRKKRNAELVSDLVTEPARATLSARRIHVVTDAVQAATLTLLAVGIITPWWTALLIAIVVMTLVSLIITGAIPRRFARKYPAQTLSALAKLLHRISLLGKRLDSEAPGEEREQPLRPELAFSEDELRDMVDRISELEAIEQTEREMIHSVFDLGDTVTREVMVPRTSMVTIDFDKPMRKAMSLFVRSGFSRIPIIRHSEDDIVGILFFKDVVRRIHSDPGIADSIVERFGRPAPFVPESKSVDDLLRMMQQEAMHLAIVVDEYGGTAGLVTMEDALEEIVGELVDEHDKAGREVEIVSSDDGLMRVPARLSLHDLGEALDMRLEDDEVDSVGGILAKALGKVPLPGFHIETHGLYLEAERTEGRRKQLSTVLVRRLEPQIVDSNAVSDEPVADETGTGPENDTNISHHGEDDRGATKETS